MPLFPDELELVSKEQEEKVLQDLKNIKSYRVKVYSCSMCPFSTELIDETGDYLGSYCEISDCKFYLKDDILIPEKCPLRKEKINIKTELKE